MNSTELIQLIVGCIAIISVLYQVARVERVIYQSIDAVKDLSERNHLELQKRLDLHLQSYADRRDHDLYIINDLNNKIEHRFNRLREHQKDIERYLEKNGNFRVRGYFTTDHDRGGGNLEDG